MHPKRYPCGGLDRRQFLAAATALPALGGLHVSAQEKKAAADPKTADAGEAFGVPGPYPGRVVEVRNKAMIRDNKRNREAIKASLARGMKELTGADDAVGAWKKFFEPGDVVGIKVVPNGHPMAPTSPELVLEVIESLKAAGVKTKDMFVFDRYEGEFKTAGYDKILPDGVHRGGLTPDGEDPEGQLRVKFQSKNVCAGYDPDEFVTMNLVDVNHDPKDDRAYRSHLGLLVTKRLNKLVLLPCLKDHGAAGVTGALKNMSHGLVNNVNRSHSSPHAIAIDHFIPTIVSNPVIRRKCVLHVMDGIRGVWQGGPFGPDPKFAWDYNALLFATDPVALDHVEWDIIDAKRKEKGVPGVGSVGQLAADPFKREGFDIRQPQHIALAGNLGLGLFDYKSNKGRRHSISHKVVSV